MLNHLTLYRKYRPNKFEEIVGQKFVTETLKNALQFKKTVHAYLFCGSHGTGKTSTAKIFAKALNCKKLEAGDLCGQCDNCKMLNQEESVDIIEMDAASNNGVDEIRQLIERVQFLPTVFPKKVYIIDEVHMLSNSAFNSLLKTLEEPPAHVVFVLATTEPRKIPLTILSRCQRYDFRKLSDGELCFLLTEMCKKEGIKISIDSVEKIAKLANGSARDAISLTEQIASFRDNSKKIELSDLNEIFGLTNNDSKIKIINKLVVGDLEWLINEINSLYKKGIDFYELFNDLIYLLRDLLVIKRTNNFNFQLTFHRKDEIPDLEADKILNFIDIFLEYKLSENKSLNSRLIFELAIIKIVNQCRKDNVKKAINGEKKGLVDPNLKTEKLANSKKMISDIKLESLDKQLFWIIKNNDREAAKNFNLIFGQNSFEDYENEKYLNLLRDVKCRAFAGAFAIVTSNFSSIIERMNRYKKNKSFLNYLKLKLHRDCVVFGLDNEKWIELGGRYMTIKKKKKIELQELNVNDYISSDNKTKTKIFFDKITS